MTDATTDEGAFAFTGNWREFAPIAFTNLLLCIVTLGLYIFWARTRERQYLWSHTRFIDDRLEWMGTGLELFIGYLMAVVLLLVPFGILQFGLQGLVLRGHVGWAALIGISLYLLILYLVGVAIFRALRYRLTRTFWHGIRGGSDTPGFAFGWSYLWKTITGSLVLGLLIPWSMTSLWNDRWNRMSFGPLRFAADAKAGPLMLRFLLFYLAPFIIVLAGMSMAFLFAGAIGPSFGGVDPQPPHIAIFLVIAVFYLMFFIVLGLIALSYYSAYFREAVGTLSLGELDFAFTARTRDWVLLFLGNFALVIVTLGIGQIFVGYRNWSFFIRHMQAYGDVNLDDLTQSTTALPGQGEGLLDAFDIGAF